MHLDQLIDKDAIEGKLKWLTHMANHSKAHSSTRPASGMHTSLNPLRNCSRSAQGHGNFTWPTIQGNIDRIRDVFCSQSASLRAVRFNEKGG